MNTVQQQGGGGSGAPSGPPPAGGSSQPPVGPAPSVSTQYGVDLGTLVASICHAWPRALAAPHVATFAAERATASWEAIGVGLAFIAGAWILDDFLKHGADASLRSGTFHAGLALLSSGALFVAARTVGRGTGDYKTQTHLYLLYHAPLSIALAITGLAPGVGALAALVAAPLVTLYGLVLSYPMLQAAHGIGGGRALRTIVALVVVCALIAMVALILIAAVVAALAALRGACRTRSEGERGNDGKC